MPTPEPGLTGLAPEVRARIAQLHILQPLHLLVALVFVALWAAAGWAIVRIPDLRVRIGCMLVIGVVIHALGNLMHDATHGNLFRKPFWDRWFGVVLGAPGLISATAWKVTHRLHHRHVRTDRDPEEPTNITRRPILVRVIFYLTIILGTALFAIRLHLLALLRGTSSQRRAVLLEGVIIYALVAASFALFSTSAVFQIWLIPVACAAALSNVRGWSEHKLTHGDQAARSTRTVLSNPVVSFFMCNLNYHLEHHLFPAVPWYNLPALHTILRDEYPEGASVRRSYLVFLWKAFRAGPYGKAV